MGMCEIYTLIKKQELEPIHWGIATQTRMLKGPDYVVTLAAVQIKCRAQGLHFIISSRSNTIIPPYICVSARMKGRKTACRIQNGVWHFPDNQTHKDTAGMKRCFFFFISLSYITDCRGGWWWGWWGQGCLHFSQNAKAVWVTWVHFGMGFFARR